jgi:hypothetical protein
MRRNLFRFDFCDLDRCSRTIAPSMGASETSPEADNRFVYLQRIMFLFCSISGHAINTACSI